MGEYLKKCEKSVAEMAMEVVGTGGMFKTRVAQEEEEEEEVTSSSKRRKVVVYEHDDSPELLLVNLPPENSVSVSTANSTTSEEKNIKSADLKDSETEISTFNITKFSRERSPSSSEVCGVESAELMLSSSTTKKKSSYTRNSRIKSSVPAAELEDFFAVFEKQEHQRFAEKYNYDVVKDVPLEGRYHWIRLKP